MRAPYNRPTSGAPAHLHVISREDAQPAVVFPLQPVLVHLLVDVDNVTLLQSQLPAGQSKDIGQLRPSGPPSLLTLFSKPRGPPTGWERPLPAAGGRGGERRALTWGTVPGSQT